MKHTLHLSSRIADAGPTEFDWHSWGLAQTKMPWMVFSPRHFIRPGVSSPVAAHLDKGALKDAYILTWCSMSLDSCLFSVLKNSLAACERRDAATWIKRHGDMARKIFVGSLPHGIAEDELRLEFESFGQVEEVFIKETWLMFGWAVEDFEKSAYCSKAYCILSVCGGLGWPLMLPSFCSVASMLRRTVLQASNGCGTELAEIAPPPSKKRNQSNITHSKIQKNE